MTMCVCLGLLSEIFGSTAGMNLEQRRLRVHVLPRRSLPRLLYVQHVTSVPTLHRTANVPREEHVIVVYVPVRMVGVVQRVPSGRQCAPVQ